jgi:hypothetical protein
VLLERSPWQYGAGQLDREFHFHFRVGHCYPGFSVLGVMAHCGGWGGMAILGRNMVVVLLSLLPLAHRAAIQWPPSRQMYSCNTACTHWPTISCHASLLQDV